MNKAIKIFLPILLGLAMCSCSDMYDRDEGIIEKPGVPGENDGEAISVSMNFFVDYEGDVDPYSDTDTKSATRAIVSVDENAVKDVYVMQFDGTGDNAVLLFKPAFVEQSNFSSIPALSSSVNCRLLIVANLGTRNMDWNLIPGATTYGEVKAFRKEIYSELSAIQAGCIPMSGTWTGTLGAGSNALSIGLTRNLAKIDLTINNTVAGLTINGVALMSVPAFMDITAGQGIDAYADAVYPAEDEIYIDYGMHTVNIGTSTYQTMQFYVPRNERGSLSWTPTGNAKNNYAPAKATYIRIRGEIGGVEKMYNVYLGGPSDFIVKPNTKYTHTVNLNSAGEPEVDSRVEDYYTVVSFKDKHANCYILNPPPKDTKITEMRYRIYPQVVNRFWGEGGYSPSSTTAINIGSTRYPWYSEILWQDIQYMALPSSSTTEPNSTYISRLWHDDSPEGEEDYFEVRVPVNAREGNFTVGIFRDREGGTRKVKDVNEQYSWSWHFWVTRYNPDVKVTPRQGIYDYDVVNGHVQRYEGELWNTGMYKNAVIMDRNLGSLSKWQINPQGKLYYQYGRKDPFPCSTVYGVNTTSNVSMTSEAGGHSKGNGVKESLANPTVLFTNASGDWDQIQEISPYLYIWKDEQLFGSTEDLLTRTDKSIFDPCPYGWQLPHPDTWKDFVKGATCLNDTRGLGVYVDYFNYFMRYWPGNAHPISEVVYPFTVFKNNSTSVSYNSTSSSTNILFWTSVPVSATSARRMTSVLYTTTSHSYTLAPSISDAYRSLGLSVRCVKINN